MSGASLPQPGDWDYRAFGPIPFDRFRDELLALYEPPLRAKSTRDKLRFTLDVLAGLIGPGGTTAALDPTLVARFVAGRPAAEKPHTTKGLVANVRTACSYAKARGYIRTSPFEFRKVWVRAGRPEGKKHHSREEIRLVLDLLAREVGEKAGWPRWRARRLLALASLFAYTGLRKLEGLRLHAGDVDLARRMIFLVERDGRRLKTAMSAQPIPIPNALAPVLEDWMAHRLDRQDGDKAPPECPWLFPNVTRTNYWDHGPHGHRPIDQMKGAGERAGVEGFTFLSLRHSFATHAECWGLSPAMIQRILRHTSLNTQAGYRHPDLDNMRRAVDGIGFGPAPEVPPPPDGGPTP